jgi:hypothetical protein
MKYDVYGAFEIPMNDRRRIERTEIRNFWGTAELDCEGIADGVGCYVFGIRSSGGPNVVSWYVGKTSKSFRQECFQPHKLLHYNEALSEYKRGRPMLFLLPKLTGKGKLSKNGGTADIDYLEKYLISTAINANQNLYNIKDTKILRELSVVGIYRSQKGAWHSSSQSLKRTLKL